MRGEILRCQIVWDMPVSNYYFKVVTGSIWIPKRPYNIKEGATFGVNMSRKDIIFL